MDDFSQTSSSRVFWRSAKFWGAAFVLSAAAGTGYYFYAPRQSEGERPAEATRPGKKGGDGDGAGRGDAHRDARPPPPVAPSRLSSGPPCGVSSTSPAGMTPYASAPAHARGLYSEPSAYLGARGNASLPFPTGQSLVPALTDAVVGGPGGYVISSSLVRSVTMPDGSHEGA